MLPVLTDLDQLTAGSTPLLEEIANLNIDAGILIILEDDDVVVSKKCDIYMLLL